jgi:hypothetical protein
MKNIKNFEEWMSTNEGLLSSFKSSDALITKLKKQLLKAENELHISSLNKSRDNFEKFTNSVKDVLSTIKTLYKRVEDNDNLYLFLLNHLEQLNNIMLNITRVKGWSAVIWREAVDKYNRLAIELGYSHLIEVHDNE